MLSPSMQSSSEKCSRLLKLTPGVEQRNRCDANVCDMNKIEVRLVDVNVPGVQGILSFAVGPGDVDRLGSASDLYRNGDGVLAAAYVCGSVVGVAGWRQSGQRIELLHIATAMGYRKQRVAQTLVDWLQGRSPESEIVAETDRDAVGFYEATGFMVRSLGYKYPGVERFEVVRPPASR